MSDRAASQQQASARGATVSTADALGNLEHIELSVDFGTSSTKLAYRLRCQNNTATCPMPIRLDNENADVPGCLAYYQGAFCYGHDLIKRVQHDPEVDCVVPANRVVESVKILFYDGQEEGRVAARARKALGNITPDQAVTDYLRHIVADTREYLHEQHVLLVGAEALLTMPVKVRLSVPQIWTLTARRRMAKAAHEAGIETVVLASEPQCVLANYLDLQTAQKAPTTVVIGDYILFVDLGCGTADFVLYRIKDDLRVSTRLEADEKFSGALCGSIRVNEQLLERVMPSKDQLPEVLERLELTKEGLEWHLLQSIEKAKPEKKFAVWHKNTALSPVNGEEYGQKISK